MWKISQNFNDDYGTYDSAIVAAETEEDARNTDMEEEHSKFYNVWAAPEHVEVEYIGEAKEGTEAGIILASFNAG